MQRSCADVNSPINESAELTQGALQLIHYFEMRSSRVVRASDSQCRSHNYPGFDPSILLRSGILGAAEEAVLNIVHKKKKNGMSTS